MSLSKENPEVLLPFVEAGCNAAEIAAFFWVSYSAAQKKMAVARRLIAKRKAQERAREMAATQAREGET